MSSSTAILVRNLTKIYELGLSGRRETLLKIAERRIRHPFTGGAEPRAKLLALDDLTFDVEAGEAVGVIGRNGAGKSTLLKILSRITPPTKGTVDLRGHVGSLLEVGTGFHPELTGLENVYLNGSILGMSTRQIDARLEEIVDFSEVGTFLDTPVKRYSSGMRVRLAFAVAAHLEPEVLIIDEVLSVGDASFQSKCLEKMRSLGSDDGRTVLYVSHNLVTVENLCPRTLLMIDGRLAFDGPTSESMSEYVRALPHATSGGSVGVFDLAAADRSGTRYHPMLQRLVFRPERGAPGDQVRMGDPVQIEIDIADLAQLPEAMLMVSVGSLTANRLFRFTSRMSPLVATGERGTNERVVIDVPEMPLVPGDYQISVSVQLDPRQVREDDVVVDQVLRAAEFTVVPADVLANGYRFGPVDGEFRVPFSWELRPGDPDPAPGGADSSTV